MMPHLSSVVLLLAGSYTVHSQGSFLNLDFEAANVLNLPYPGSGELVDVTNGMPGWNISPTAGLNLMGHNALPLGGAAVSILGPDWPSSQILEGTYTVELFASTMGPPIVPAIFQTGQIPTGSQSIRFYGAGDFSLTFAAQNIPLTAVGSGPNYTIFGGDISNLAGQTGQLVFEGNGLLDNIFFSTTEIPEPNALGFLALGASALGWRLRCRFKGRLADSSA